MFDCGRAERDTLDNHKMTELCGDRGTPISMPECLYEHANLDYYNT